MSEWTLVLFTVALQLSSGLALAATISDWRTRQHEAMRPAGTAVFPIAAVGLLGSLFHLGRPLSAMRAFRNLGSSWLSLEVLLASLFALVAIAYSYYWRKGKRDHRLLLGIVTSGLGLAVVASSATVYLIPARPAWYSGWVPLSFAGTTLLFAGFGAAGLAELKAEPKLLRIFLTTGIAGSSALFGSAIWMLASLSRQPADSFESARLNGALHLVTTHYLGWFGIYLLLTGVFPFAAAIRVWPRGNLAEKGASGNLAMPTVFIGSVLGMIAGRAIMYAVGLSLPPF